MAATVKRFDFGSLQDFREPPRLLEIVADNSVEIVEAAPPPPPPTFSEAQLEAAKGQAFEEGRQAGLIEGKQRADTEEAQRMAAILKALERIATQSETIPARHLAHLNAQAQDVAQLALAAARQLAGDAVHAAPQAGVERMIRDCLNILLHQPKVRLSVHPSLTADISRFASDLLARRGSDCELAVQADAALGVSDARMEWKDGLAERRVEDIWAQIETRLKSVDFSITEATPQTGNE